MKKWEYCEVGMHYYIIFKENKQHEYVETDNDFTGYRDTLAYLGNLGWELVASSSNDHKMKYTFFLKREKTLDR